MPTDDLISVIIPAYNHERYIEECIRSIMAQTYRNIELLIIDDGSTDGTFVRMQELKPECERRFSRVIMLRSEHTGLIKNLNATIDTAQGKYIFSLASDDMAKPRAIEVLHKIMTEDPDCVLATADSEIINGDSERVFWGKDRKTVPESEAVYKTFGDDMHLNERDNRHQNFGDYEDLLKGNYIPNCQLKSKESLLKAGKYNPDIFPEDWYMNLQLAKLGKFRYTPEILFSYRWHGNNTVSSAGYKARLQEIYRRIYEHEKEYCFANGYKKQWKKQWCKRCGWRAKWKNLRDRIRGKK